MHDQTGEEKVLKIEKIGKIDPSQQIQQTGTMVTDTDAVAKTKFDQVVERVNMQPLLVPQVATDPRAMAAGKGGGADSFSTSSSLASPIATLSSSSKVVRLGPISQNLLVAKAEEIQTSMQRPTALIQETLKTNPDATLSPVDSSALSDRLIHIDTSLNSALNIVGAETKSATGAGVTPVETGQPSMKKPLVTFLNYLTHGDTQINSIISEVNNMKDLKQITPQQLLAVQIKLGFVQQELEFFTNLLSKALESTKTIMNVQV